jgi:hypothetical protein
MNTTHRVPFVTASLVLSLALVFASFQTGHAAPPAQNVVVTNTAAQAVPITAVGTTTVAGSVAIAGIVGVQQSSPWTVAIDNNAATAVPVRIVADEPWSADCSGPGICDFVVPAAARLVIQNISCSANMATGDPLMVRVEGSMSSGQAPGSGSSGFMMIAPVSLQLSSGTRDFYGCNQPTLQQVDAGSTVHVAIIGNGAVSQARVNLSGHLVPLS